MRVLNPMVSMRFRARRLPLVRSTLAIIGGKGRIIVRIRRRVKGHAMHYVLLTTDRKLRGKVRIATANKPVGIPIKGRALKHVFGMLKRTVSGKRPMRSRRG